MTDYREQRACIKFCFKLGKTATQYYEMLKTAISRSQTFKRVSRFKAGRTSTDDDKNSGRPVSSSTPEMIERVCQIIRENRRRSTIDEVSMLVGISHRTCHKMLTEYLKMRRVASKGCYSYGRSRCGRATSHVTTVRSFLFFFNA